MQTAPAWSPYRKEAGYKHVCVCVFVCVCVCANARACTCAYGYGLLCLAHEDTPERPPTAWSPIEAWRVWCKHWIAC